MDKRESKLRMCQLSKIAMALLDWLNDSNVRNLPWELCVCQSDICDIWHVFEAKE
jgi:hypothetical protein